MRWPQGLRPHSEVLPKATVIRIQAELCLKSYLVSQLQMWQDLQGWGLRRSTESGGGSRSSFSAPTFSTVQGVYQLVSPQPAGAELPQSPGPPWKQR